MKSIGLIVGSFLLLFIINFSYCDESALDNNNKQLLLKASKEFKLANKQLSKSNSYSDDKLKSDTKSDTDSLEDEDVAPSDTKHEAFIKRRVVEDDEDEVTRVGTKTGGGWDGDDDWRVGRARRRDEDEDGWVVVTIFILIFFFLVFGMYVVYVWYIPTSGYHRHSSHATI